MKLLHLLSRLFEVFFAPPALPPPPPPIPQSVIKRDFIERYLLAATRGRGAQGPDAARQIVRDAEAAWSALLPHG
jgi:hypothetical protein